MACNKNVPVTPVHVYTVCDESRYLIVRNVPSFGCGLELANLFGSYGPIEDCKPMDAEECERFTDVYWIKFQNFNNARFAKRKLDDFVFLGNKLQVSYAPQFESVFDTREKLECRRKEVMARIKSSEHVGPNPYPGTSDQKKENLGHSFVNQIGSKKWDCKKSTSAAHFAPLSHVSSNQDYFSLPSMNKTVHSVREKLEKISRIECQEAQPELKKRCIDNRRRI